MNIELVRDDSPAFCRHCGVLIEDADGWRDRQGGTQCRDDMGVLPYTHQPLPDSDDMRIDIAGAMGDL